VRAAAATFPNVAAFNVRVVGAGDYRRAAFGGAVVALGSAGAVAVMAGTATVAAAWMVSSSLSRNPALRAAAPIALEVSAIPRPPQRLADAADMFGSALASANPVYALPSREPEVAAAAQEPKATPAAAPAPAIASAPQTRHVAEAANTVPLPQSRPPERAPTRPDPDITSALAFAPPMSNESFTAPLPSALVPPQTTTPHEPRIGRDAAAIESSTELKRIAPAARGSKKPAAPQLAYNNPDVPPARDSRTAIYDIMAHTVYLPDGERLEAHSGLGRFLDDPHYASQKGRGPTPPNTYDLTLRSGLFHGVQAIRLNPVADSKMYGRDGILAHTYMLGPSGQSFGCVSFKNYGEFLRAFQRGEIDRLVVVPHLQAPPAGVRAQSDDGKRYAFAIESGR
jgi:hypothetical protein